MNIGATAMENVTTKEFKKEIKALGLTYDIDRGEIKISYDDYTIAIEPGEDPEKLEKLFLLIVRYAHTPPDKRGSEIKEWDANFTDEDIEMLQGKTGKQIKTGGGKNE